MKAAITSLLALSIMLTIGCDKRAETSTKPPTAASPNITPTTNPTPSSAVANFQRHCIACHGDSGEAGIVKINDKTLRVPSLRHGHATEHTNEKLAKQIAEGDDEMPPFKDKLSAEEISDLVHYIRKEFQGK